MNSREVLEVVEPLNREQQKQWLIDLGWSCTVSARSGYPIQNETHDEPGSLAHLVGFNEIQHQIYNRMKHLSIGDERPLEDFLQTLLRMAQGHGIDGDFGWALKSSIQRQNRS